MVHVWRIKLSDAAARLETLSELLDPAERERAARFRHEREQLRFIVSHGARREILAEYVDTAPDQLRFHTSDFGKPSLVNGAADLLTFNMTHSADVALFAVGYDRRIGVDVEFMRPNVPANEVARRFFSPSEYEALNALAADARYRGFFACWTRKEAYLKARGQGLTVPLDSFDVTVDFDESPELLRVDDDPGTINLWSFVDLPVGPSYVAALVAEGQECIVQTWHWSG